MVAAASRRFTQLPPLSLYIHIPWCVKKCPYCDFNSHEFKPSGQQAQANTELPEDAYVTALLADLEQEMPDVWGRQIHTVFIGGGTPSLFSAAAIDRLLSGVRALTAMSPTIEVTMEANPGTFEQAKFADFRAAGINRLSIGVQSFNDASLLALGRIHDSNNAIRAVEIARKAGFDNINLDLMYGLPEQSFNAALADVNQAIALAPEHISYYQLTLEPNTLFANQPPVLPADDNIWDMQQQCLQRLQTSGYQRYETSAFCQSGKQSEHNMNYWLFGDYLGIGAGAHGKISDPNDGQITRRWKQRHPRHYLEQASTAKRIGGEHVISIADTGLEFMMNALRLTDGFSLPLYGLNTGVDIFPLQPIINQALDDGLLEQQELQLRPSEKGIDFLNDLLDRFVTDDGVKTYPVIPLLQRDD